MREQVDFVQQHQPGGAEHVRVLERLVVALRHRGDQHLGSLTEIEERGADQVADVLDEDDRARLRLELGQRARHHLRVEVATGAGVDLHGARAGRADPVGVALGRLIALDHGRREPGLTQRALEQRGLPRARRADQVQRQRAAGGQPAPVALCDPRVLRQHVFFHTHDAVVMVVVIVTLMVVMLALIVPVVLRLAAAPASRAHVR